MIVIINKENENLRADIALSKLSKLSRHHIKILIDSGYILKNWTNPIKSSYKVKENEQYKILLSKYQEDTAKNIANFDTTFKPDIIYEDDFLAVINKPEGMVVHPAPGNLSNTLSQFMEEYFSKNNKTLSTFSNRPGIVHRLDKDTSGLMLIAKTDQCHNLLQKQFSDRKIIKIYLAKVSNIISTDLPEHFWIQSKIGPHDSKPQLMKSFNQKILSSYKVNKFLLCKDLLTNIKQSMIKIDNIISNIDNSSDLSCTNNKKTLYKESITEFIKYEQNQFICIPHTGRQHQIRVHLQKAGYPISGDVLYNKNFSQNRLFLHAIGLRFYHPLLNKEISIIHPINFI